MSDIFCGQVNNALILDKCSLAPTTKRCCWVFLFLGFNIIVSLFISVCLQVFTRSHFLWKFIFLPVDTYLVNDFVELYIFRINALQIYLSNGNNAKMLI